MRGRPFLLLMCKIRKTTGEQADSGVRTLHREQPNHDQLRGPGFITSLLVRDAFLISIEGGESISSSLSGRAAISLLLIAPPGKEYDISALRLDK